MIFSAVHSTSLHLPNLFCTFCIIFCIAWVVFLISWCHLFGLFWAASCFWSRTKKALDRYLVFRSVYLVTSSVKSKKQTLIYIAWTCCLIHCMDALLTPAGRKRCGPSGSSEQWDRGAVQKVALLTPAGRKRCSLFFGFLATFKARPSYLIMPAWSSEFRRFTRSWHFFVLSLCLNLLPKRKAIKSLESGGHPGISMLRLVFSELAEASCPFNRVACQNFSGPRGDKTGNMLAV